MTTNKTMPNHIFKGASPHKKELQDGNMHVPVIFHTSDKLMPSDDTIEELRDVAFQENIFHYEIFSTETKK